jgi:hypothetical protein
MALSPDVIAAVAQAVFSASPALSIVRLLRVKDGFSYSLWSMAAIMVGYVLLLVADAELGLWGTLCVVAACLAMNAAILGLVLLYRGRSG